MSNDAHYAGFENAPCPSCAAKDAEVARLTDQLERTQGYMAHHLGEKDAEIERLRQEIQELFNNVSCTEEYFARGDSHQFSFSRNLGMIAADIQRILSEEAGDE